MSFIEGQTTGNDAFALRPDQVESIKAFDDGAGRDNGVIIIMKSGASFRTATYDFEGAKDALGINT